MQCVHAGGPFFSLLPQQLRDWSEREAQPRGEWGPCSLQSRARSRISLAPVPQLPREKKGTACSLTCWMKVSQLGCIQTFAIPTLCFYVSFKKFNKAGTVPRARHLRKRNNLTAEAKTGEKKRPLPHRPIRRCTLKFRSAVSEGEERSSDEHDANGPKTKRNGACAEDWDGDLTDEDSGTGESEDGSVSPVDTAETRLWRHFHWSVFLAVVVQFSEANWLSTLCWIMGKRGLKRSFKPRLSIILSFALTRKGWHSKRQLFVSFTASITSSTHSDTPACLPPRRPLGTNSVKVETKFHLECKLRFPCAQLICCDKCTQHYLSVSNEAEYWVSWLEPWSNGTPNSSQLDPISQATRPGWPVNCPSFGMSQDFTDYFPAPTRARWRDYGEVSSSTLLVAS